MRQARAGGECPLLFSLQYAPPEVIVAASTGQRRTVADPKVDVWALGVVAFELLTGTRVFSAQADRAEVLPYMSGARPLPWEAPGKATLARKLGSLRRTVLACLSRNPQDRPSSTDVLRSWNGLFESETATRTGLLDDVSPASGVPPLTSLRSGSLQASPGGLGSRQGSAGDSESGRRVPALGQGGMRQPEGSFGMAAVHITRSSASLASDGAAGRDEERVSMSSGA